MAKYWPVWVPYTAQKTPPNKGKYTKATCSIWGSTGEIVFECGWCGSVLRLISSNDFNDACPICGSRFLSNG